ncbi:MAG: Asp-tRNA(Asn)/Glu-tRNA(Gln) amidotransferase subunit GatA [Phycisphaerales bacterium]
MNAFDLADRVRRGGTTARAEAEGALARLAHVEPKIRATTQTLADEALRIADEVDARLRRGESIPLAGVPIAIKDNICTAIGRTTCASRMLEEYRSPFDATVVTRLLRAGCVPICKSNLDEFAMGSSTEHSAFHVTRNPWDVSRVPGGSSGGSAALVAAGVVPVALGSDTGGSIRQPASMCGVVGLKPTYGRVSRFGLVAFASSLDQIGPITADVRDAALVLDVIAGGDENDSTCSTREVERFAEVVRGSNETASTWTIGVPREARSEANQPEVARVFDETIARMRDAGATLVDVDLPMTDAGIAAYYIVCCAEASSNLARYDGIRFGRRAEIREGEGLDTLYARSRSEGLGDEVKRRIMLGTHVLSSGYYDAYYTTALKARRKILEDFNAAFARGCDCLLMPTAPTPAFTLGEKTTDPVTLYLEDVYTVGVNLAGLPAIGVPAGLAEVGGTRLPVGVQLVGSVFEDARVLRCAAMVERLVPGVGRAPIHAALGA